MKVAYAIATWNGFRLVETIQSVPTGSRLLVVDTSQHDWCLAKAWNYATERLIRQEKYDAVIVMNDDIQLRPDTGDKLAKALLQDQFTADVGVQLLLVSGYNTNGANAQADEGDRFGVGGPDYSCFAIGEDYLRVVGPFDENFSPAYFEDNDSHYRIRRAGYEAAQFTPYTHHASTTLASDPALRRKVQSEGLFEKCRSYYISKWGGEPGREIFVDPFGVKP